MMIPASVAGDAPSSATGGSTRAECRTMEQQTLPVQYLEYPMGHSDEIADRAESAVGYLSFRAPHDAFAKG